MYVIDAGLAGQRAETTEWQGIVPQWFGTSAALDDQRRPPPPWLESLCAHADQPSDDGVATQGAGDWEPGRSRRFEPRGFEAVVAGQFQRQTVVFPWSLGGLAAGWPALDLWAPQEGARMDPLWRPP